ncbi:MAG: hypothetical protein ACE5JL_06170 [Dehalococcoidia bacterium]
MYDRYIVSLALLLTLTTVILAAYGESRLDLYFTVYLIEALVLVELYVYFSPRARRGLNVVSAILLAGFIVIVVLAVAEILIG